MILGGTVAPFAEEMAVNTERRYDKILKDLREAPYRTPGERVVTADAKDFIEKGAALQQSQTKTAGGAGSFFGGLGTFSGKAIEAIGAHPVASAGLGAGILGAGALFGPSLDAWGEKIKDNLVPDNQRDEMMDSGASSFATSVGNEVGKSTVGLFGDLLSKGLSGLSAIPQNRAREGMFAQLQQEDDVLSQADPQSLQEAYHTMVRFAPTLATDKNAVRSFLRESVLYGTGPNVVTIKQLADAEQSTKAWTPPGVR